MYGGLGWKLHKECKCGYSFEKYYKLKKKTRELQLDRMIAWAKKQDKEMEKIKEEMEEN